MEILQEKKKVTSGKKRVVNTRKPTNGAKWEKLVTCEERCKKTLHKQVINNTHHFQEKDVIRMLKSSYIRKLSRVSIWTRAFVLLTCLLSKKVNLDTLSASINSRMYFNLEKVLSQISFLNF